MYAWSVDCVAWQEQHWFHFTVLHDGGVPGGGTASWGDTAHVPCHQGGPDHHPGHRHHNRQHPNATPSQGWLAGAQLWLNSIQWVCAAVLMSRSFPPALAQLHPMGVQSCTYAPTPHPPLLIDSLQRWPARAQFQLGAVWWLYRNGRGYTSGEHIFMGCMPLQTKYLQSSALLLVCPVIEP